MRQLVAIMAGVVALGWSLPSAAEDKCPISGGPAKEGISLEVNGKKVSFCCEKCPEAYKKKINLKAEKAVKTCPISGKEGSEKQTVIVKMAKKVAFCCTKCQGSFAKKNKFEIKDSKPGKCPLSGGPAKDAEGTSLVVNGNKVFFCCKNCPKKFQKQLGLNPKTTAKACAISGKPVAEGTQQIFVESHAVSFCCGDCKGKWTAANFKDGVFVGAAKKKRTSL